MRPLTLLLDIHHGIHHVGLCSVILTKDKRQMRHTHKIKSSDAAQRSVLTSLTASLGKSHAVTLVSITSPQLRQCSHTHHYESKLASFTAFGAFHRYCSSTFNFHTSAILLHPLQSHSNQLRTTLCFCIMCPRHMVYHGIVV